MKLLELHINGFGKFTNTDIHFSEGMNIIYGYNETGKSTIHSFIRAMLYGMERGRGRARKNDTWSRYEPWEKNGAYGGMLKVLKQGEVFRIERDFTKSASLPLVVVNESKGVAVENTKNFFNELMCGLSETSYINTISIGQLKSATDAGMVNELKKHISNINTSGNMTIDITKAGEYLKAQKKDYIGKLQPEVAKSYAANLSEIKLIEEEITAPYYVNTIKNIKEAKAGTEEEEKQLLAGKEVLIKEISDKKQSLKDNGFSTCKEIDDFEEEVQQAYDRYSEAQSGSENSVFKIGMTLMTLLCIICIALTFLLFFTKSAPSGDNISLIKHNTLLAGLALSCIIFFLISFFMIRRFLWQKREYLAARSNLLSLFDNSEDETENDIPDFSSVHSRLEELKELAAQIDKSELKLVYINNKLINLNSLQQQYNHEIETQQKYQWELEKQIEQLSNLKDENLALKQSISDNSRFELEIFAIDVAREVIQNLSLTIRNSFGLYLNKEASVLIKGITAGAYDSLSIDENLNVFMNTRKRLVPMDKVSSGTIDQIYLALRLASAKLLQGEGEELPLVFDDSFVNYDENRLRSTLEWLHGYYERQILIFTCHTREESLLHKIGIDFNSIKI